MKLYDDEHQKRIVDLERIRCASIPIRKFFGAMTLEEIDDGTAAKYVEDRRSGALGRVVQNGTIRRELAHLSAVMHYAARNSRRTGIKPGDVPRIPLPPSPEPRSRVATEAELDRLMHFANLEKLPYATRWVEAYRLTRAYRFMAIARWTAARKESIETLMWNRVDLERGVIDFRDPLRVQTAKRRVPVPIDPQLLPIMRRAFAERNSLYVLDIPGGISIAFKRASRHANLMDITPHTLRHTWATRAAERGVSAWKIATFLGDRLETVEKNYMHRSPGYLSDVFESRALTPNSGASQT